LRLRDCSVPDVTDITNPNPANDLYVSGGLPCHQHCLGFVP